MEANEEQEDGRETVRKVVISALLISTYICVGAYRSIPGPTLIDFKHILGIQIASMPLIFTARALGYVAGCIIGGFILNYLEVINKKKLFMSPFLFIMSMTALAVPFCHSLVALSCTFFVSGICMIILAIGVNVYYFNIWRSDNIYYLTLQSFYAVGSLLGPIIYGTSSQVSFPFINFKTLNTEADSRDLLKISYTYFVLSFMMFCVSAMWIGMYWFTSVTIHVQDIFANGQSKIKSESYAKTVVGLTSTLIYTIGVLDIGYPQMIATYTYTSYGMSTEQGADITSVFWGCYAAGSLLAIFVARKFQLIQLIVLDLFLEVSAGFIFATLSRDNIVYLHLANAILGFGTAAIYPLTINWLRRHVNLTNKTIGAVFLLESFSEMTLPVILGQALTVNHDSLAYFVIASPVSYAIIFALQYGFTYWYQNKHNILQHTPTNQERLWMGPVVPKFFIKKPIEEKSEPVQLQQEKTMDIIHELDVIKERVQNKTASVIRSLRTLESTGIRGPSGKHCAE